jgi:hypothetical protein
MTQSQKDGRGMLHSVELAFAILAMGVTLANVFHW